MNWDSVKGIADSKIVKSSFIWLIIAPVTAKMLSKMNDTIDLSIFGSQIKLSTSLPFSWQLLFFSACFFTAANIIYSTRCPKILKDYKCFTGYVDEGKTILQVHTAMKEMVWDNKKSAVKTEYIDTLSQYFKKYCEMDNKCESHINKYGLLEFENTSKAEVMNAPNNAFDFTQNIANVYNQNSITTCFTLYSVGLILTFIIAVENIIFVIKTML